MWTARLLTSSREERPLALNMIEGRHASLRELAGLARETVTRVDVAVPWGLIDALAEVGPVPWADPIAAWASLLAERDGITVRGAYDNSENPALESEALGLRVWHQPSAVVIPIPNDAVQIAIDYEWDRGTRFSGFVEYGPNAEGEILPTLDGRLYTGSQSAILETDDPPTMYSVPREMHQDRQPLFRWFFGVANRSGMFIGRIVRRFVRRPAPITHDPGFLARLEDEESRLGSLDLCPRIDAVPPGKGTAPLAIVIHGTFSCAVDTAMRIQHICPQLRIARFEHDTFLPIPDNVRDLLRCLGRLAEAGQTELLLLAHSRGGLVACQAAALAGTKYPGLKVTVWTVGTPHSGTPLAGTGGLAARGLGALYRLCARWRDGPMRATYAEGAAAYLTAVGELPPGISSMREGSDFLTLHRLHAETLKLRTWGARCSPTADGGAGQGMLLSPAIAEVFDHRPNDLVVPTSSAILDNSPAIGNCSHFRYFDQPELRTAIATFCRDQA